MNTKQRISFQKRRCHSALQLTLTRKIAWKWWRHAKPRKICRIHLRNFRMAYFLWMKHKKKTWEKKHGKETSKNMLCTGMCKRKRVVWVGELGTYLRNRKFLFPFSVYRLLLLRSKYFRLGKYGIDAITQRRPRYGRSNGNADSVLYTFIANNLYDLTCDTFERVNFHVAKTVPFAR